MDNLSEIKKNVFVLQRSEYDESNDVERCSWLKIDLETQQHYKCDFSTMHLPPDEIKNCLVEVGFTDFHFYKKRSLETFHPENDNGFSVVAKK